MKSEKRDYKRTRFPAEVIKKAVAVFDEQTNPEKKAQPSLRMTVVVNGAERGHDDEDEFFADYRKDSDDVAYNRRHQNATLTIHTFPGPGVSHPKVTVEIEAEKWPQILAVMEVFETNKQISLLPESETQEEVDKPVIFIGHGPTDSWKDLRDHLRDKHAFDISAYEIGARAGHGIRGILESMLDESSMAFLVMTGDDKTVDGELHPRLNVVHEAGLFQGRLGFDRAVVVLEEGVTEFSNIHGIEQIRFKNIKEVFGDVLATIHREFPKG